MIDRTKDDTFIEKWALVHEAIVFTFVKHKQLELIMSNPFVLLLLSFIYLFVQRKLSILCFEITTINRAWYR